MTLRPKLWYVRWFYWSADIIHAFFKRCRDGNDFYTTGSNLCQFMRVVFVWAPLIVIAHIGLYSLWFFIVFINPILIFGTYNVATTVLTGVMIFTAAAGFVWILSQAGPILRFFYGTYKGSVAHIQRAKDRNSFVYMIWLWVVAKKRRMCPLIRFDNVKPRQDMMP